MKFTRIILLGGISLLSMSLQASAVVASRPKSPTVKRLDDMLSGKEDIQAYRVKAKAKVHDVSVQKKSVMSNDVVSLKRQASRGAKDSELVDVVHNIQVAKSLGLNLVDLGKQSNLAIATPVENIPVVNARAMATAIESAVYNAVKSPRSMDVFINNQSIKESPSVMESFLQRDANVMQLKESVEAMKALAVSRVNIVGRVEINAAQKLQARISDMTKVAENYETVLEKYDATKFTNNVRVDAKLKQAFIPKFNKLSLDVKAAQSLVVTEVVKPVVENLHKVAISDPIQRQAITEKLTSLIKTPDGKKYKNSEQLFSELRLDITYENFLQEFKQISGAKVDSVVKMLEREFALPKNQRLNSSEGMAKLDALYKQIMLIQSKKARAGKSIFSSPVDPVLEQLRRSLLEIDPFLTSPADALLLQANPEALLLVKQAESLYSVMGRGAHEMVQSRQDLMNGMALQ